VTDNSFNSLGLAEPLLRALSAAKYTEPTPIQAQTIPLLLQGRDVLGIAQTGTGKTAAFALPVLQRLAAQGGRARPGAPRALVVAPTRELAVQIARSFDTYGRSTGLRLAVLVGGLAYGRQIEALRRGVDILIATPGRLLDLMEQGHLRLGDVGFLVLDEADRMFDMGFIHDVRRIVAAVNPVRQTLMFSATMPPDVAALAARILKDPARVEIAPQGRTVDRIDQGVFFIDARAKRALLERLLADPALERVIVFTRTKRGANRVAEALDSRGVSSAAIHGNKSQNARQRALDAFTRGHARVLVATDLAARGIDVRGVTHVINFELPADTESYVHRIGRTARAGAAGVAWSLCDGSERGQLRAIERLTRQPIAVLSVPGDLTVDRTEPAAPREERGARPQRNHAPKRHAHHGSRGQNGPRGEQRDRQYQGERQQHADRPQYEPRLQHADRPQYEPRSQHGDRPQYAPRSQRADRPEYEPRSHHADRPQHAPRPQRADRPQHASRPQHQDHHRPAANDAGPRGERPAGRAPWSSWGKSRRRAAG